MVSRDKTKNSSAILFNWRFVPIITKGLVPRQEVQEARLKPQYIIRTVGLRASCKVHIICHHRRGMREEKKKKHLDTFLHLFWLFFFFF